MNLRAYQCGHCRLHPQRGLLGTEQGSPSSSSEESDTGSTTSSVDSLFANPRVSLRPDCSGRPVLPRSSVLVDVPDQEEELPSLVRIRREVPTRSNRTRRPWPR